MYGETTPHTNLDYLSNDVTLNKKSKIVETFFPILIILVGLCGVLMFLNS